MEPRSLATTVTATMETPPPPRAREAQTAAAPTCRTPRPPNQQPPRARGTPGLGTRAGGGGPRDATAPVSPTAQQDPTRVAYAQTSSLTVLSCLFII